jgi:hypothetical protein
MPPSDAAVEGLSGAIGGEEVIQTEFNDKQAHLGSTTSLLPSFSPQLPQESSPQLPRTL